MKIKKEFIDLIYNGEKKYEFRNSNDKAGFYKIKDKYFKLVYVATERDYTIKKQKMIFDNGFIYYFNGYKITFQEYEWIKNNMDYFIDNETGGTYNVIYKWVEIEIKQLEEVE